MKTISTPVTQVNNTPLKIVPGNEKTTSTPYLHSATSHPGPIRNEKEEEKWDSPENWDEAWFSNYE